MANTLLVAFLATVLSAVSLADVGTLLENSADAQAIEGSHSRVLSGKDYKPGYGDDKKKYRSDEGKGYEYGKNDYDKEDYYMKDHGKKPYHKYKDYDHKKKPEYKEDYDGKQYDKKYNDGKKKPHSSWGHGRRLAEKVSHSRDLTGKEYKDDKYEYGHEKQDDYDQKYKKDEYYPNKYDGEQKYDQEDKYNKYNKYKDDYKYNKDYKYKNKYDHKKKRQSWGGK